MQWAEFFDRTDVLTAVNVSWVCSVVTQRRDVQAAPLQPSAQVSHSNSREGSEWCPCTHHRMRSHIHRNPLLFHPHNLRASVLSVRTVYVFGYTAPLTTSLLSVHSWGNRLAGELLYILNAADLTNCRCIDLLSHTYLKPIQVTTWQHIFFFPW